MKLADALPLLVIPPWTLIHDLPQDDERLYGRFDPAGAWDLSVLCRIAELNNRPFLHVSVQAPGHSLPTWQDIFEVRARLFRGRNAFLLFNDSTQDALESDRIVSLWAPLDGALLEV